MAKLVSGRTLVSIAYIHYSFLAKVRFVCVHHKFEINTSFTRHMERKQMVGCPALSDNCCRYFTNTRVSCMKLLICLSQTKLQN